MDRKKKHMWDMLFLLICVLTPIYGERVPESPQTSAATTLQPEAEDDSGGVNSFLNIIAHASPKTGARMVSRLATEKIWADVLVPFPADTILLVTRQLNDTERMRVLGSLNGEQIMNLTSKMTPGQKAELLSDLPSEGIVGLSGVLSSEQLGQLLMSLPAESVVNLTRVLNEEQNYQIISRLSSNDVVHLVNALNGSKAAEVLNRLPPAGILNITSTLTSDQISELMTSLEAEGVFGLVLSLPPQGVTGLISKLPPSAVSELLTHLPPDNLLNLIQTLPPEDVERLLGSVSPQAVQNLTLSLQPEELAVLLKTLPPSTVRSLLSKLPTSMVAELVTSFSADAINELLSLWPSDIVVNVTNALNVSQMVGLVEKLSPGSVVSVASVLPSSRLNAILSALPKDVLINLTMSLDSLQLQKFLNVTPAAIQGTLISSLPAEALTDLLHKIPPNIVGDLIVSIPASDMISSLGKLDPSVVANLTMSLSPDQLSKLLQSLSISELMGLVGNLPPDIPGKLIAAVPVQTLLNLTKSMPPEIVGIVFQLIQPDDLSAILQNVPTEAVPELMQVLPPQVLASLPGSLTVQILGKLSNETIASIVDKLSIEQLLAVMISLPESNLNDLLTTLPAHSIVRLLSGVTDDEFSKLLELIPKNSIANLITNLEPEAIVNLTMTMSPSNLAQILLLLDPATVSTLLDAVPQDIVVGLIFKLPPQLLANLTAVLPDDKLTEILTSLNSTMVAHLLSSFPREALPGLITRLEHQPEVLLNLTMSLPQDALVTILTSLPDKQLGDLIQSFPQQAVNDLITKIPVDLVLNLTRIVPSGFLGGISVQTAISVIVRIPTEKLLQLINDFFPNGPLSVLSLIPQDVMSQVLGTITPDQIQMLLKLIPPEKLETMVVDLIPGLLQTFTQGGSMNLTDILVPVIDGVVNYVKAMDEQQRSQLIAQLVNVVQSVLPEVMQSFENLNISLEDILPELLQMFMQGGALDLSSLLKPALNAVVNLVKTMDEQQLNQLMSQLAGTLLSVLPELMDIFQNMNISFENLLPELLQMLMQGGAANLNQLLKPALDAVVNFLSSMDEEQMDQLVSQLGGLLRSVLPGLMESVGGGSLPSAVGSLVRGLVSSLVSGIPVSSLMSVAGQMIPELPRMLARSLSQMGSAILQQHQQQQQSGAVGKQQQQQYEELSQCVFDLQLYLLSLANGSEWAVRMFDATGKPARGMLKGNTRMYGSYDYCLSIDHWATAYPSSLSSSSSSASAATANSSLTARRIIRGSYCGAHIDLPDGLLPPVPGEGILPDVEVALYLCLPNSCKARDLTLLMSSVSLPLNITVPEITCQEEDDLSSDGAAITAICVLCFLGLFLVVGTTLDVLHQRKNINNNHDDNHPHPHHHHYAFSPRQKSNNYSICTPTTTSTTTTTQPSPHPLPRSYTNGGLDLQEGAKGGDGGGKSLEVGVGEKQTSFIVGNKNGGGGHGRDGGGARERGGGGGGGWVEEEEGRKEEEARIGGGGGGREKREKEEEEEEEEEFEGSLITKAFVAFSLHRNTRRILGVRDVSGSVTCLHGIRVLSMFWLIVGNSVLYVAPYYENSLGAAEVLETILGQVVIQSTLAVDSFFVISGCLTMVVFLREVAEEGGVRTKNALIYFFHRFVRLTPAYAVTIMALTCLLPYMSDGPEWTEKSRHYYRPCQSYWWTNLLYVNNFYPSLKDQCVPWGWYLATDLQFHWLVAPFVLLPLAAGYKVISFVLLAGLVFTQAVLTYYLQADINGDYLRNRDEFWWEVFQKPYTRVAPYAMGLTLGYVLTRIKGQLNIRKVVVVVGWVAAIGVIVACVLIKYGDNHVMLEQPFHWSAAARAWHETLYRIFFSAGLCWVIFMCATGYGGFINSILSWKVFVPVSHLVFCMYLLHPAVILADLWQTRVSPYFTVSWLLQRASGYILLSAIFAYFLSVTVEVPIGILEKIVLNNRRRKGSKSDSCYSTSTAL